MNSKKVKKIRKETRKIVGKSIDGGLETLSKITRKRPKWIPKKIWILFYLPLFKRKHLGMIYKYIK